MQTLSRWLGWVLLAVLGLAVLLRTALFFLYVFYQGRTPFEAYHLESKMVWLAWRAGRGLSMYPEWHAFPHHEPNFFGPLYFLVVGGLGRLANADLRALHLIGRSVTIISGLIGALLVGLAARTRYGGKAGLVAGTYTLSTAPMIGFGLMTRPDVLADTLGFAGFILAAGKPAGGFKRLAAAGLLLAASGLTKQTAAAYLLAAALSLAFLGRPRAGALLIAWTGALVGSVVLIGTLTVEPRFLSDLMGEAATPASLPDWLRNLNRLWAIGPEIPLLCLAGLWLWLRPPFRDPALAVLNVVLATWSLATSTKLGADLNYFLGSRLVASLALGALWNLAARSLNQPIGTSLSDWTRQFFCLAGLVGLIALQYPGLFHNLVQAEVARSVTVNFNTPQGRAMLADYQRLCALAANPDVQLLTDDGALALRQLDRAPFVDPWLFRMRVMTGRMNVPDMEQAIIKGKYDFVITRHDLDAPTYATYDFGLPPNLAASARRHYQLAGSLAGHYIYTPRARLR